MAENTLSVLKIASGQYPQQVEIDLFASVVQDDHMVLPTVSIAGSFQRQKAHQKS